MILGLMATAVQANNIPPVAVIDETPNRTWFYNAEEVAFSAQPSYDNDGYINYTKWYINGVFQTGGSYFYALNTCFVLYGSVTGDCYELPNGVTTVTIKLEVRDNHGNWDSETKTYTIQEHKGRKYFIKDHLGSVRTTVNRDGNVLGYDDYYPFGLTMPGRSSNSANPNDNYKFTGHERDDEAGLNLDFMNARNYDPIIGRFLQIDPLADQFPQWTPYHYVHNNPLNLIDPTGMAPVDWVEKEDGSIYWDENATSQSSTKQGEKYLGKNVIVATHNRDENDKEEVNSATFDLYLESDKTGPSATIKGNTVPADVEGSDFSTLAEGLYAADFAPRTAKPKELAVFISQADRKSTKLPTTDGGTMEGIFLHSGNPKGETLISRGGVGSQFSEGCQTTRSGPGSAAKHTAFMKTVGKKFKGTYYLRAKPQPKKE